MVVVPYLIPLAVCLALYVLTNGRLEIAAYAAMAGVPLVVTGIVHYYQRRRRIMSTEYLGSYVVSMCFEDSWHEIVRYTEQVPCGKDSNGNTIYREVERIRYDYHPPKWTYETSIGSSYECDEDFFDYAQQLWEVDTHEFSITGSRIRGGVRYGSEIFFQDCLDYYPKEDTPFDNEDICRCLITLTEEHKYVNKIRNSNSIFKFEDRSESDNSMLFDYPEYNFDQNPIMGLDVPSDVVKKYKAFNALYGPSHEVRLYVIFYNAEQGITVAEDQRAYWHGGNKNELVVCLGIGDDKVKWCNAFSWMDEPVLEVAIETYFRNNTAIDLMAFLDWLRDNIDKWQRKSFSDFNYLTVRLTPKQVLLMAAVSALTCGAMWYFYSIM